MPSCFISNCANYLEFGIIALGVVLLLLEAFVPKLPKPVFAVLGAIGLGVAWAMLPNLLSKDGGCASNFGYVYFFKTIILVATILSLLMSVDFKSMISRLSTGDKDGQGSGEFYILPLFACAGMLWMVEARDFITLFISLELTTITFYVMVGFFRRNVGSLEAGVKYLVLGAISTGILVYGISWIYGMTGTFSFEGFAQVAQSPELGGNLWGLLFGVALVLVAVGFKVGAAPMQMWIPDVYQGAPMPVTALLSVASKTAGFGVLVNLLVAFSFFAKGPLLIDNTGIVAQIPMDVIFNQVLTVLFVVAVLTLLVGNLAAIVQSNVKRLLGYSSIAHAGFVLSMLAYLGVGETEHNNFIVTSVIFYLITYLVMTMGAFYVLAIISAQRGSDDLKAFHGLAKTNPRLAVAATILFAGLSGLPLTAGFAGKFLVFLQVCSKPFGTMGINWTLLVVLSVCAITGFYYYFKVIRAMYMDKPQESSALPVHVPVISAVVLALLVILTVALGVFPVQIMNALCLVF